MKKMNLAEGSLLLLGFLFIVIGLISKATDIVFQADIGIFAPMVKSYTGIFLIANTCFLMALVLSRFGKSD